MPTLMEVYNFRSLLLLHHTTCKQTKSDEIINWNITSKEKKFEALYFEVDKKRRSRKACRSAKLKKEIKDALIVVFHTIILGYII